MEYPPLSKKLFNGLVKLVNKPWQVYISIAILSMIMMLLNWGLAPVVALYAVEVCKRVKGVDFRLACAALYSGMLVWHGGLSASAPLMMATEDTAKVFIEKGIIKQVIPITESLLIPLNLVLIIVCFITLPIVILLLKPSKVDEEFDGAIQYEKVHGPVVDQAANPAEKPKTSRSPADWLNESPIISIILFLLCIIGSIGIIKARGFNLASLALLMLAIGLLLHYRPINYVNTMKTAIKSTSDIILQFPLFGGIMSIFIATGLAVIFAKGLVGFASAQTLPFFAYLSSAIVNLFIPSGGGEWLVLGTPLLEAARMSGASTGKTVMAFAYGDAITNLINPFWTLIFLPIMGHVMSIRPRDFMGYTMLICIIFFIIESVLILFL